MAEHKIKPMDHQAESAKGDEGSGHQHPTGSGPAYKEPKDRGSGRKPGGKRGS